MSVIKAMFCLDLIPFQFIHALLTPLVTIGVPPSSHSVGGSAGRKQGAMGANKPGDLDAVFERLFNAYQQPILNYLYRLVGDVERAEELTQDVFLKAYRALASLPADANQRAWLYRIATNTAYDQLRRSRLLQWLPLLEERSLPTSEGSPEERTGEQQAVQQALAQLPFDYRAPLILFSVQGYSIKEIGEMLGISEGAVKTRLCRAREKFREVYRGKR